MFSSWVILSTQLWIIQEKNSTCCSEGDLTSPLRPRSECDLWKLRGGCTRPPPPTSGWWWWPSRPPPPTSGWWWWPPRPPPPTSGWWWWPPRGAWKVSWGRGLPPPRGYSMVLHTEYTPGLCSIWNRNVELYIEKVFPLIFVIVVIGYSPSPLHLKYMLELRGKSVKCEK